MIKKVFVLVKTYDEGEDGFDILGVFDDIFKLKQLIKDEFVDYVYEKDRYDKSCWVRTNESSSFSTHEYLNIYTYVFNEIDKSKGEQE